MPSLASSTTDRRASSSASARDSVDRRGRRHRRLPGSSPRRATRARTSAAAPATGPGRPASRRRARRRPRATAARRTRSSTGARRRCPRGGRAAAASPSVARHAVERAQERDGEVVGHDRARRSRARRAAASSAVPRRRRPGRRRCRCRRSSPSGRRRAAPSRTAAGSRRPARAGPMDTGARLRAGARGRVSREVLEGGDDAAALQPAHVRRADQARRGTGPRRASPRPGPNAGRGRRRAPARVPGGPRGGAWSPRSGRAICSTSVGVEGRAPSTAATGRSVARQAASPVRHSSCTWAGIPNRLAAITSRCRSASARSPSRGSTGAVPNGRVSWPRPSSMSVVATAGPVPSPSRSIGRHPTARPGRRPRRRRAGPTFSASVIRPTRSATRVRRRGADGSRQSSVTRSPPGAAVDRRYDERRVQGDVGVGELLAGDQRDEHARWRRGPAAASAAARS